ncbi:tetratricopeptide repeat protein [Clostridium diolis]|uniref:tetratricopeptide repeat protein n=1 Tax=Clostridium diolis TaxID=223919 RepID=UPI003AF99E63
MNNILIKDIVENLNPNIVCDECIVEIEKIDNVEDKNFKIINKYIHLFKEKNIAIKEENINELNEILCKGNDGTEEDLKIDSLWYVNINDNKVYFYSFQGFSYEFLDTYKKMKSCSFIRYVFDNYFKEKSKITNIQDYISIKLREYINWLTYNVGSDSSRIDCSDEKVYLNNLYDDINYISTLTYEGNSVSAKIIIFNNDLYEKYIDFYIQLEEPIKFEEYRKVRKLLETSDKSTYLIADNEKIYGLGRFKNISRFENINKFENNINALIIEFTGQFEYKLNIIFARNDVVKENINSNEELLRYCLDEHNLINIRYGKADLKEYKYSEKDVEGAISYIFKEDFKEDYDKKIELLRKIIGYAKNQKHGTTVVITLPEIAKEEVSKLKKQSIKIKPIQLKNDEPLANTINRITNIDGALYLDIDGVCYAIGVILDGWADNEHGDSSRGARFNSAIKYSLKDNLREKCIVVVVSEDGMINIIHKGDNYKQEKKINELVNEIRSLLENNNFEKVLEKADEIIKLDHNNEKAYAGKGMAYMKLKEYEEAIKCYDKAVEIKPDYSAAYNNKGNVFVAMGNNEKALECYDKASEFGGDIAEIYNNKGVVFMNLGKNKEALENYDKAIEIKSDYYLVYKNKAKVLKNLGRDQEAEICNQKYNELTNVEDN